VNRDDIVTRRLGFAMLQTSEAIAVREVSQNPRTLVRETANNSKIFDIPSVTPRPLGVANLNVHLLIVGRPGLDPGTLGLKGQC
jgi:hypothetical protein